MDGDINIINDDDEIIIIDNPCPKPPPPIVILFDSDDDDDNNSVDDDNGKEKEKEKNNKSKDKNNQRHQSNQTQNVNHIDLLSGDDSDSNCMRVNEVLQYVTEKTNSDSNCMRVNEVLQYVTEKTNQMKEWYEKYKTKKHTRMKNSTYTCPECRAGVSTIYMIDRHLQSRHPKSLHRFQKNHQNNPPILQVLSDSEGSPVVHGNNLTQILRSNSVANSKDKDRSLLESNSQMMPSLRLNPLPVITRKMLPEMITKQSSQIDKNSRTNLPATNITPVLCPLSPKNLLSTSTTNSSTVVTQPNSTVSQSTSISLPPLPRIRINVQNNICTATSTSESKSCNPTRNSINNPLTVVIYSPNHEQAQSRMVQINSPSNDLSSLSRLDSDVTSTKRKRDLLVVLTDDERDVPNPPKKILKVSVPQSKDLKNYKCEICGQSFIHLNDKHKHCKEIHDKTEKKKRRRRQRRQNLPKAQSNRPPPRPAPYPTCITNSSSCPPKLEKLQAMKHIVLIDIDNWQKIFESDLEFLPSTFVWCFQGGAATWRPPRLSVPLRQLQDMKCFYLHPKCGRSKDAADFAMCVQAGKLDVLLPKEIPFTVLSGDKGFNELRNQLSLSKREVHIVDPHNKSIDTVLTILNSIADR